MEQHISDEPPTRTLTKTIICCPEHSKKPKAYYKHLKSNMPAYPFAFNMFKTSSNCLSPKIPIREDLTEFDENSETKLYSLYSPATYTIQLLFSSFITLCLTSKLFKTTKNNSRTSTSESLSPASHKFYTDQDGEFKYWTIVYSGIKTNLKRMKKR